MEGPSKELQEKYDQTFLNFLKNTGEMLISYGELEKLSEQIYGKKPDQIDLTKLFDWDELRNRIEDTDPEIIKKLAVAMFEMITISNKLQNLNNLPPEEKIDVGKRLKEIAKILEEIDKTCQKEGTQ
ncbi:hypothetical protein APY94_04065 [Thermococcus celericrescens]|uniref:Uncharacterized protein n=1 Tax=Thermococcus celericrescens TaxID=227598 RepID=A0A100XYP0_9EURY|nr:hypothetical protein [Thermococcus celericrescens]KUH33913.1 hypothetical protein APY94_04065 [Thermococcus celericrescens]